MSSWPDELVDFNPKNWLKQYRKTSVVYLLKMAFFYHVVGLGLMYGGSALANEIIDDYEVPFFPVSLASAITAGPIEEIFFFGLPYYLSGNLYYLLGTGVFWSVLHIFNTETFDIANLTYGGFLFTVPHLFFSIRTWISKKGWFAIAFHSAWNVSVLFSFCFAGLRECVVFNSGEKLYLDLLLIPVAVLLIIIMYLIHLRSQGKNYHKRFLVGIIIVFIAVEIPFIILNFEKLF